MKRRQMKNVVADIGNRGRCAPCTRAAELVFGRFDLPKRNWSAPALVGDRRVSVQIRTATSACIRSACQTRTCCGMRSKCLSRACSARLCCRTSAASHISFVGIGVPCFRSCRNVAA